MSTKIQAEVDRLNAVKSRIRTNLVAQGITVPSDTMLDEMATMILSVAGEDGYTPVRGIDYWTEADKEAIVQQVITALGTPVFGRVDENNNIILTGELADGVYTLKYEDAEGNTTVVGTLDTSPGYTNMIPLSVEADDTPYNDGQGWKTGYRLRSNGEEAYMAGMEVIGFIPFKRGDVIRFSGITMNKNSTNATQCYFIQYDSNKAMVAQWIVSGFNGAITKGWVQTDSDGNITQINTGDFTLDEQYTFLEDSAYFRISADEINDDSIITINQEIPEEEPAYTNLFDPTTASINTRMSGSSGASKAQDGYVMTAIITLPEYVDIVSGSYDENTPYIAVPTDMWSGSANLFGKKEDGSNSCYVSAEVTAGTTVGTWKKIPIYNQFDSSDTINKIVVSLYVKATAITESDIQNIGIYYNEIPE